MTHSTYLENEVMTASPGKLVILLYEGAIRFLRRLDGLEYSKNIELKNHNINKAYAIISELQSSLNMDYKEISEPLFSLYNYMSSKLVEANIRNNPEGVQDVIHLLNELKEAWVKINQEQHSEAIESIKSVSEEYSPFPLQGNSVL